MNTLILICNRLIKLFANASKALGYVFHFFFPAKRFTIPKKSDPWFSSKTSRRIPAVFWQTNFSNRATLPIYLNYLFNRLFSPTFEYRFMDNDDCLSFIAENFPGDIHEAFLKLKVGAAKADFWRLLVLEKAGGVYMDVDAHFVWPLPLIIKPGDRELYVKSTGGQYTNYFLASEKNNPNIRRIIEIVLKNIKAAKADSVYSLTGPPCVNSALEGKEVSHRSYRHTCVQGSFTNEHFQYMDKPKGKWTHAKANELLEK